MSTLSLVFLVFVSSFLGMILLIGIRLRPLKNMSVEQVCQGLVSCESFFNDFSGVSTFFGTVFKGTRSFFKKIFERTGIKKYYCYFSNYVHGRHAIEKNECEGYWGELNGGGDKEAAPESGEPRPESFGREG